MKGLTRRQREILEWILDVVGEKGYFPSFREIGDAFGLRSPASVARHIDALVKKGFLVRDGDRIHPAEKVRGSMEIPIVGQVAAGRPILAEEHIEGGLDLRDLYGKGAVFAVRVKGESMRDAGIRNGDYAIVRAQRRVASGDVALVYLGDDQEATVKIFRWKGDRVELLPKNPAFKPIRVGPEDPDFRVGGKVIGVVRRVRGRDTR